jgi:anti-sigma-K factor RskA
MTTNEEARMRQETGQQMRQDMREEMSQELAGQDIEALLPWYAAGTLRRRDRQRVEDALKSDPALSRHAELVREELAETIRLNELLGAPSARAMDRLMASIDAEVNGRHKIRSVRAVAARIAAVIAGLSPRTLAITAAAAVLAIAVQAFVLLGVLTKPQATYQTAAVDSGTHKRGAFALVRFAKEASAAEITKFLEAYKATLVDGPKAGGFYRVKVAMTALAKEELARIVMRMQHEQVVEFAAPTE